jgi:RND family efflux transporter MFP subunit
MMKRILTGLVKTALALCVVAVAMVAARNMIKSRPVAEKAARPPSVPVVEVIVAGAESRRTDVVAMGTVVPARRLTVQPEVGGRIVDHHPSLTAGGVISAGEELLRIDRREYEIIVEQQEAQVEQVRTELRLEEGRRYVAEREWELFESDIASTEMGRELALREPQIRRAESSLKGALSGLERARLNVERTVLNLPFNALVLEENVEIGQLVSPQSKLATLVGTDRFWIQVSVPADRLDWIRVPGAGGGEGSAARVLYERGGEEGEERKGKVVRLLGELDPVGRMARVLVMVDDPLGLQGKGGRPLLLGSYVRVEIEGREVPGLYRVPRTALRDGEYLWILGSGDRLEIRPVEILWSRKDEVFVSDGVGEGERIIVSRLGTPVQGMALRAADTGKEE